MTVSSNDGRHNLVSVTRNELGGEAARETVGRRGLLIRFEINA